MHVNMHALVSYPVRSSPYFYILFTHGCFCCTSDKAWGCVLYCGFAWSEGGSHYCKGHRDSWRPFNWWFMQRMCLVHDRFGWVDKESLSLSAFVPFHLFFSCLCACYFDILSELPFCWKLGLLDMLLFCSHHAYSYLIIYWLSLCHNFILYLFLVFTLFR